MAVSPSTVLTRGFQFSDGNWNPLFLAEDSILLDSSPPSQAHDQSMTAASTASIVVEGRDGQNHTARALVLISNFQPSMNDLDFRATLS